MRYARPTDRVYNYFLNVLHFLVYAKKTEGRTISDGKNKGKNVAFFCNSPKGNYDDDDLMMNKCNQIYCGP